MLGFGLRYTNTTVIPTRRGPRFPRFSPLSLFANDEPGFFLTASPDTCFTDTAGTTNAGPGDAVAYWKDLSGRNNHATQATLASRPILGRKPEGGRRNLLQRTEEFDNAYWSKFRTTVSANAATAPDGTNTADALFETTDTASHILGRNIVAGVQSNFSVYVKANGRSLVYVRSSAGIATLQNGSVFNLSTGSLVQSGTSISDEQIESVGDGWYRLSGNRVNDENLQIAFMLNETTLSYTGETDKGIFIWGAQVEIGSTATNYQRVTTAFDVTEAGKPDRHYLFFGGSADPRWMQTPTITPGTDKAQVFAGVRKLSDAAIGGVVRLGSGSTLQTGEFWIRSPETAGVSGANLRVQNAGGVSAIFTGPLDSAVISGLGSVGGDFTLQSVLRVNGLEEARVESNVPAATIFRADIMGIGSQRAGQNANPFNGEISTLIARFGPNLTTEQIEQMEAFVASKVAEDTI